MREVKGSQKSMAPKRNFPSANGGRGESPTRSGGSKRLCSRRHDQGCALQELTEKLNPSDLQLVFNIFCRGCTLQEFMEKLNPSDLQLVEDLCRKYRVNVPYLSSRTRMYRLQFRNKLPRVLFSDRKLKAESEIEVGKLNAESEIEVKIAIVDASNMVISSGPVAKAEIEIVVLDGDFCGDDNGEFTEEEFNKHVIGARKDKPTLLLGNLFIKLCEGVGCITDAKFTDNSSWTRSKNFRLGARLYRGEGMAGKVQEGISNAFRVKDRHGEKYQKDRPPSMYDDVCCLKGIFKNGPFKKKLVECNIKTVWDFLNYCDIHSPEKLRTMLGMTEGMWAKTYGHARESKKFSNINQQPLNGPVNMLAPYQNYVGVPGSSSSQISKVWFQPDGIMQSLSNVECESDMLTIAQSPPATKSGFESLNSVEEIVSTGGMVWKGTEQLGIPPEVQMEGDGGRDGPIKFGDICLQLFYVVRFKVRVRRSREARCHKSNYHNARDLSCSCGSWPQCKNFSPRLTPDEDIDERAREIIYGHAIESESWINDLLPYSAVNHPPPDQMIGHATKFDNSGPNHWISTSFDSPLLTPDQIYLEDFESISSQIPNVSLQPDGIMQLPPNVEGEPSLSATESTFESLNSFEETVIAGGTGGMVCEGTEQLDIPPEVQMEGDGGRDGPIKFCNIWLRLFYVVRFKVGVRRFRDKTQRRAH